MDRLTIARDDRGQSEIVGWVIVVGLIVASISLVTFNGVPALNQEQEAQKVQSIESVFGLLQGSFDEISSREAEVRSTQMDITGDSVTILQSFDNPTLGQRSYRINVSIVNDDGEQLCPETVCNTSYKPIRFASDENAVTYANGGVMRVSPGSQTAAMIHRPDWVRTNQTLLLPVLPTRGQGSFVGTGTVDVQGEAVARKSVVVRNSSGLNVTVNVTTRRPVAWRTYGDGIADDVTLNPTTGKVVMRFRDVQKVIHDKTVIEVSFI